MFVLVEMTDTVRLQPWLFGNNLQEAVTKTLNDKLANKVVYNIGLCIALWDLTRLEDSFIFPGDGASHTIVHHRFVVFRPFIDEVLEGTIKSCSREGVQVSMGFFDDILIPADSLQNPSTFDEQEQLWYWEYEVEEEKHNLYMDLDERIRFRVIEEIFTDLSPSGPDASVTDSSDEVKSPYKLVASINESGLGLLSWWNS